MQKNRSCCQDDKLKLSMAGKFSTVPGCNVDEGWQLACSNRWEYSCNQDEGVQEV